VKTSKHGFLSANQTPAEQGRTSIPSRPFFSAATTQLYILHGVGFFSFLFSCPKTLLFVRHGVRPPIVLHDGTPDSVRTSEDNHTSGMQSIHFLPPQYPILRKVTASISNHGIISQDTPSRDRLNQSITSNVTNIQSRRLWCSRCIVIRFFFVFFSQTLDVEN
jgi:hypothetical protein